MSNPCVCPPESASKTNNEPINNSNARKYVDLSQGELTSPQYRSQNGLMELVMNLPLDGSVCTDLDTEFVADFESDGIVVLTEFENYDGPVNEPQVSTSYVYINENDILAGDVPKEYEQTYYKEEKEEETLLVKRSTAPKISKRKMTESLPKIVEEPCCPCPKKDEDKGSLSTGSDNYEEETYEESREVIKKKCYPQQRIERFESRSRHIISTKSESDIEEKDSYVCRPCNDVDDGASSRSDISEKDDVSSRSDISVKRRPSRTKRLKSLERSSSKVVFSGVPSGEDEQDSLQTKSESESDRESAKYYQTTDYSPVDSRSKTSISIYSEQTMRYASSDETTSRVSSISAALKTKEIIEDVSMDKVRLEDVPEETYSTVSSKVTVEHAPGAEDDSRTVSRMSVSKTDDERSSRSSRVSAKSADERISRASRVSEAKTISEDERSKASKPSIGGKSYSDDERVSKASKISFDKSVLDEDKISVAKSAMEEDRSEKSSRVSVGKYDEGVKEISQQDLAYMPPQYPQEPAQPGQMRAESPPQERPIPGTPYLTDDVQRGSEFPYIPAAKTPEEVPYQPYPSAEAQRGPSVPSYPSYKSEEQRSQEASYPSYKSDEQRGPEASYPSYKSDEGEPGYPPQQYDDRTRVSEPPYGSPQRPPEAAYGPPEAAYAAPGAAAYETPGAAYGPAEAAYGPAEAAYGPAEAAYGPAEAVYGPPQAAYGPPEAAYGGEAQRFDDRQPSYGPGARDSELSYGAQQRDTEIPFGAQRGDSEVSYGVQQRGPEPTYEPQQKIAESPYGPQQFDDRQRGLEPPYEAQQRPPEPTYEPQKFVDARERGPESQYGAQERGPQLPYGPQQKESKISYASQQRVAEPQYAPQQYDERQRAPESPYGAQQFDDRMRGPEPAAYGQQKVDLRQPSYTQRGPEPAYGPKEVGDRQHGLQPSFVSLKDQGPVFSKPSPPPEGRQKTPPLSKQPSAYGPQKVDDRQKVTETPFGPQKIEDRPKPAARPFSYDTVSTTSSQYRKRDDSSPIISGPESQYVSKTEQRREEAQPYYPSRAEEKRRESPKRVGSATSQYSKQKLEEIPEARREESAYELDERDAHRAPQYSTQKMDRVSPSRISSRAPQAGERFEEEPRKMASKMSTHSSRIDEPSRMASRVPSARVEESMPSRAASKMSRMGEVPTEELRQMPSRISAAPSATSKMSRMGEVTTEDARKMPSKISTVPSGRVEESMPSRAASKMSRMGEVTPEEARKMTSRISTVPSGRIEESMPSRTASRISRMGEVTPEEARKMPSRISTVPSGRVDESVPSRAASRMSRFEESLPTRAASRVSRIGEIAEEDEMRKTPSRISTVSGRVGESVPSRAASRVSRAGDLGQDDLRKMPSRISTVSGRIEEGVPSRATSRVGSTRPSEGGLSRIGSRASQFSTKSGEGMPSRISTRASQYSTPKIEEGPETPKVSTRASQYSTQKLDDTTAPRRMDSRASRYEDRLSRQASTYSTRGVEPSVSKKSTVGGLTRPSTKSVTSLMPERPRCECSDAFCMANPCSIDQIRRDVPRMSQYSTHRFDDDVPLDIKQVSSAKSFTSARSRSRTTDAYVGVGGYSGEMPDELFIENMPVEGDDARYQGEFVDTVRYSRTISQYKPVTSFVSHVGSQRSGTRVRSDTYIDKKASLRGSCHRPTCVKVGPKGAMSVEDVVSVACTCALKLLSKAMDSEEEGHPDKYIYKSLSALSTSQRTGPFSQTPSSMGGELQRKYICVDPETMYKACENRGNDIDGFAQVYLPLNGAMSAENTNFWRDRVDASASAKASTADFNEQKVDPFGYCKNNMCINKDVCVQSCPSKRSLSKLKDHKVSTQTSLHKKLDRTSSSPSRTQSKMSKLKSQTIEAKTIIQPIPKARSVDKCISTNCPALNSVLEQRAAAGGRSGQISQANLRDGYGSSTPSTTQSRLNTTSQSRLNTPSQSRSQSRLNTQSRSRLNTQSQSRLNTTSQGRLANRGDNSCIRNNCAAFRDRLPDDLAPQDENPEEEDEDDLVARRTQSKIASQAANLRDATCTNTTCAVFNAASQGGAGYDDVAPRLTTSQGEVLGEEGYEDLTPRLTESNLRLRQSRIASASQASSIKDARSAQASRATLAIEELDGRDPRVSQASALREPRLTTVSQASLREPRMTLASQGTIYKDEDYDQSAKRLTTVSQASQLSKPRLTTVSQASSLREPRLTTVSQASSLREPRSTTVSQASDLKRMTLASQGTTYEDEDFDGKAPRLTTASQASNLNKPRSTIVSQASNLSKPRLTTVSQASSLREPRLTTVSEASKPRSTTVSQTSLREPRMTLASQGTTYEDEDFKDRGPRSTTVSQASNLSKPRLTTTSQAGSLREPRMTTVSQASNLREPRSTTVSQAGSLREPRMTLASQGTLYQDEDFDEKPLRSATASQGTILKGPRSTTVSQASNLRSTQASRTNLGMEGFDEQEPRLTTVSQGTNLGGPRSTTVSQGTMGPRSTTVSQGTMLREPRLTTVSQGTTAGESRMTTASQGTMLAEPSRVSQGTMLGRPSQGTMLSRASQGTMLSRASQGTMLRGASQGTMLGEEVGDARASRMSQAASLKQPSRLTQISLGENLGAEEYDESARLTGVPSKKITQISQACACDTIGRAPPPPPPPPKKISQACICDTIGKAPPPPPKKISQACICDTIGKPPPPPPPKQISQACNCEILGNSKVSQPRLTQASQGTTLADARLTNASRASNLGDVRMTNASRASNFEDVRMTNASRASNLGDVRMTNASMASNLADARMTNASRASNLADARMTNASRASNLADARMTNASMASNLADARMTNASRASNLREASRASAFADAGFTNMSQASNLGDARMTNASRASNLRDPRFTQISNVNVEFQDVEPGLSQGTIRELGTTQMSPGSNIYDTEFDNTFGQPSIHDVASAGTMLGPQLDMGICCNAVCPVRTGVGECQANDIKSNTNIRRVSSRPELRMHPGPKVTISPDRKSTVRKEPSMMSRADSGRLQSIRTSTFPAKHSAPKPSVWNKQSAAAAAAATPSGPVTMEDFSPMSSYATFCQCPKLIKDSAESYTGTPDLEADKNLQTAKTKNTLRATQTKGGTLKYKSSKSRELSKSRAELSSKKNASHDQTKPAKSRETIKEKKIKHDSKQSEGGGKSKSSVKHETLKSILYMPKTSAAAKQSAAAKLSQAASKPTQVAPPKFQQTLRSVNEMEESKSKTFFIKACSPLCTTTPTSKSIEAIPPKKSTSLRSKKSTAKYGRFDDYVNPVIFMSDSKPKSSKAHKSECDLNCPGNATAMSSLTNCDPECPNAGGVLKMMEQCTNFDCPVLLRGMTGYNFMSPKISTKPSVKLAGMKSNDCDPNCPNAAKTTGPDLEFLMSKKMSDTECDPTCPNASVGKMSAMSSGKVNSTSGKLSVTIGKVSAGKMSTTSAKKKFSNETECDPACPNAMAGKKTFVNDPSTECDPTCPNAAAGQIKLANELECDPTCPNANAMKGSSEKSEHTIDKGQYDQSKSKDNLYRNYESNNCWWTRVCQVYGDTCSLFIDDFTSSDDDSKPNKDHHGTTMANSKVDCTCQVASKSKKCKKASKSKVCAGLGVPPMQPSDDLMLSACQQCCPPMYMCSPQGYCGACPGFGYSAYMNFCSDNCSPSKYMNCCYPYR